VLTSGNLIIGANELQDAGRYRIDTINVYKIVGVVKFEDPWGGDGANRYNLEAYGRFHVASGKVLPKPKEERTVYTNNQLHEGDWVVVKDEPKIARKLPGWF
jgi:hypothetical protein